jgi:hypothetical protein
MRLLRYLQKRDTILTPFRERWQMRGSSPRMTVYFIVMAGLDPAISVGAFADARIRSAHDGVFHRHRRA